MTARAFAAIIAARLYDERAIVSYCCIAALLVGLLQPRSAAGSLFFCSFVAALLALVQSPGRYPHLDRCEQSAPLFGRELARAKALVPCIASALAVVAFGIGALVRGNGDAPLLVVISVGAAVLCTLTALSATLREGWQRLLYIALAAVAAAIAYALAVVLSSIPGELGFCALASFFALRQYGETLARYDPI